MNRRLGGMIILAALLLLGGGNALAQSGGQFCVRGYQDTNGNGVLDAESEPLLTRGVGVELLDADNVVIASALLDRSPNATNGVVCFQNLPDGTYSVLMSSADFTATTPRLVERNVSTSGLPVVIEFGAQRVSSGTVALPAGGGPRTPEQQQTFVFQLALSTVGTVLVVVVMLIIGMFIYILRLRNISPRPVPASAYQQPAPETGRFQEPVPPPGSTEPRQSSLDETGPNQPVEP